MKIWNPCAGENMTVIRPCDYWKKLLLFLWQSVKLHSYMLDTNMS